MKKILKKRKEYVYQKMVDEIRHAVRNGSLSPGQWLAGENALVKEYGISRISVRAGLDLLKSEGLVESVSGVGIRIIGGMKQELNDVMLIHPIRFQIGSSIAGLYYNMIISIQKLLASKDVPLKLFLHDEESRSSSIWKNMIFPRNMGVILLAETKENALPDMTKVQGPLVQADHRLQSLARDSVEFDSLLAGRLAVEHFSSLNCKRLAYVAWDNEEELDPGKREGAETAAKKLGIDLPRKLYFRTKQNQSSAKTAIALLLESGEYFDGIIAYSSDQAAGVQNALDDAGKGNIPIFCLGVSRKKSDSFPHLSPDYDEMAKMVYDCLIARSAGDASPPKRLFAKLSVRRHRTVI